MRYLRYSRARVLGNALTRVVAQIESRQESQNSSGQRTGGILGILAVNFGKGCPEKRELP
jgi:hypothetical protein